MFTEITCFYENNHISQHKKNYTEKNGVGFTLLQISLLSGFIKTSGAVLPASLFSLLR